MTCLACGGAGTVVEAVPTVNLARRWAGLQAHGPAAPAEIRRFVCDDVGAGEVRIWQCASCGLEWADPLRTWTASHYPHEPHSLGWDGELALREVADKPPLDLLDVGCADGQFLARAAALGHRPAGVDFSPEDVAAARAAGFEAYVADLSAPNPLAGSGRQFDAITLFQVIEHLEQPDFVFSGLAKLARPGSLLFIGCPSSRRYTRAFPHGEREGRSDFWDFPPQHVLRWTPAALRAFLRRHGWSVERVAFEPLRPYHAAAHLAGLGQFAGRPIARKLATLWLNVRLRWSRATGIRLFARARRS